MLCFTAYEVAAAKVCVAAEAGRGAHRGARARRDDLFSTISLTMPSLYDFGPKVRPVPSAYAWQRSSANETSRSGLTTSRA